MKTEQEYIFEYLDDLRESGTVNMFGSSLNLAEDLGMDRREAREWVKLWMETFAERHQPQVEDEHKGTAHGAEKEQVMSLKDVKKGAEVAMVTFTGMKLGLFTVSEVKGDVITVQKKDGTSAKFSAKTGKQMDAKNDKYANAITLPTGDDEPAKREANPKKAAKPAPKKPEPVVVEEDDEVYEDDDDEDEDE